MKIKILNVHLEGIDGSGKSTVYELLKKQFERTPEWNGRCFAKYPTFMTSSIPAGQKCNGGRVALHTYDFYQGELIMGEKAAPVIEMSRHHGAKEVSLLFVYDRSFLSTLVYQGGPDIGWFAEQLFDLWNDRVIARMHPEDEVESAHVFMMFDVPPKEAAKRLLASEDHQGDEMDGKNKLELESRLQELEIGYNLVRKQITMMFRHLAIEFLHVPKADTPEETCDLLTQWIQVSKEKML